MSPTRANRAQRLGADTRQKKRAVGSASPLRHFFGNDKTKFSFGHPFQMGLTIAGIADNDGFRVRPRVDGRDPDKLPPGLKFEINLTQHDIFRFQGNASLIYPLNGRHAPLESYQTLCQDQRRNAMAGRYAAIKPTPAYVHLPTDWLVRGSGNPPPHIDRQSLFMVSEHPFSPNIKGR